MQTSSSIRCRSAEPTTVGLPARVGADVSRARSLCRRFLVETDALTFVELLELRRLHRAAMEKPLLAPIVADETETAIPDQAFNRAVRHVAVPPRAVAGRP
jgi:hypothetical protein